MATGEAEEPKNGAERIYTRLRDLDDWKTRINWVGAGLVGLIALLAATGNDSSAESGPSICRALAVTLVLFSGGLLAYARVNFEWAASRISHELEATPTLGKADGLDRLPEEMRAWPKRAEQAFSVGLVLILLSAVAFFVSIWWEIIAALLC
jgi:hypothetical protein